MPLSRRDKSAPAEQGGSSLSSKFRNIFSKDKAGTATPAQQYPQSQPPLTVGQADDAFFRRPSPSRSPLSSPRDQPPLPAQNGYPSPGEGVESDLDETAYFDTRLYDALGSVQCHDD